MAKHGSRLLSKSRFTRQKTAISRFTPTLFMAHEHSSPLSIDSLTLADFMKLEKPGKNMENGLRENMTRFLNS